MASYIVRGCSFKKNIEIPTPEGDKMFAIYTLMLDDGTQIKDAEWKTLPPPRGKELAEGEQVDGTLTMGNFGWVFKKAKREGPQKPNYAAAVGKPNTGRDSFRKHPAEVAAVQRAHAQEMALRYMVLMEPVVKGLPKEERERLLLQLIDFFEGDVNKAMKEAELEDQATRLADAGEKAVATAKPQFLDPMQIDEMFHRLIEAKIPLSAAYEYAGVDPKSNQITAEQALKVDRLIQERGERDNA